jgi:hypothetical protein
MPEQAVIGTMIKKIIKCRNRTLSEVADKMGIKAKTFSAQLINNTITADTLFRLASYLGIDLNRMMMICGYQGPVSYFEREMVPRMNADFRDNEKRYVLDRLDDLISENPTSTSMTRRELIKEFHNNMFYLLDVLVPAEYELVMAMERGKTRYYVDTHEEPKARPFCVNRPYISCMKSETHALDIIIEERKEKR